MKKKVKKKVVDLSGPDGNAFHLLGLARILSENLGKDKEAIQKEMTAGDYSYLLEVFESHFSDYVTLTKKAEAVVAAPAKGKASD